VFKVDQTNKIKARQILNKKTDGKLIAFVGVDGSGKSTVSSIINKWLIDKQYVSQKVYLGSGDGEINTFALIVSKLRSGIKSLTNKTKTDNAKRAKKFDDTRIKRIYLYKNPLSYISMYLRAISIYTISKDNRKKLIQAHECSLKGEFIIFDRFPQLKQKNINDGPKLENFSEILNSRVIKWLAKYELKNIQIVNEIKPDIVFRLNASPEISLARKAEHTDVKYLRNKAKLIKEVEFEGSIVYEIDSNNELEIVLEDIKGILLNQFIE
jgi:thymidylate kinase